ncbi:MAG: molybdate ABC transporter substrate-binding protein [Gemmatimonadaceae bacterium]|nr:molybdate ABC transporter substrate-binding protein [Acetobacteraceae bacterium]
MHRRLVLALLLALAPVAAHAQGVTVMAAASLTDAMRSLGQAWAARGNPAPRFSFAASSALARQIEQGAPADIFISADEPWMDHLQQRALIVDGSRTSPLGNRLVLIAPADQPGTIDLSPGVDLLTRLGPQGRIATGDPASVPVGRYAQASLSALGVWDQVSPRLARAENVRAALLLVERGEAPLGIVYATDAAASRGVRVVGTFPGDSHPPISYPFAIVRRGDRPEVQALFAFLTGPDAAPVYRQFGFSIRE